jgi:tetratricopeptide (TPR) repeat protein
VGRPRALARLIERLASERRLALCGLPGSGKTTLAAAAARAHPGPVLWISLTDRVTSSAESLIRRIALFLRGQGYAEVEPLLRRDDPAPLSVDRQADLLAAGMSALAAAGRPALVCLDNFYHVQYDAAVVQLLSHLAAASASYGLLISREAVPLPGLPSMMIGGLEEPESAALLAALGGSGAGLVGPLAARLVERVGGNPMLLRLAIGQLLDEGGDPADFVARLETRPQVSRHLLDSVRERLSPAAWRLLAIVAVMRRPVDLYDELLVELMAEAGEPYGIDLTVNELQRMLLVDDPAHAVLHPLLRDHVYAGLVSDLARRRRLHRVAAEWVERAHGDLLLAAHHYARSDDLQQAMEVLADRAEALRELGQAMAAAEVVDELLARARRAPSGRDAQLICPLLTLRGDLLAPTVRVAEAEANYRSALTMAGHPAVRARITARLAFSMVQRGLGREALALIDAARAALDAPDTLLRVELAIGEAWALRVLSRYEELLERVPAYLALADRLAEVLPREAARAQGLLRAASSYALYTRRRLAEARAEVERVVADFERAGATRMAQRYQISLGHVLLSAGELGGALAHFDAAVEGLRAIGDGFSLEYALSLRLVARLLVGDMPGSRDDLDASLALRRSLGIVLGAAGVEGFYQRALLALGRIDEVRPLNAQLEAAASRDNEGRELAHILEAFAGQSLIDGNYAAAVGAIARAQVLPAPAFDVRLAEGLRTMAGLADALSGDLAGGQGLVAADTPDAAGPWAALERLAVRAAIAALAGDKRAARTALLRLRMLAESSEHRLYLSTAGRIEAALAAPLDAAQIPALLWVHSG